MNRVKFLSKIALAASLSLALAFTTSCTALDEAIDGDEVSSSSGKKISSSSGNNGLSSSGGNGQGLTFNENSQIYEEDCYWDEDYEYNCNIAPYTINGYIEVWGHGSVGSVSNGIVNLQLPSTIPSEDLDDFLFLDEDEIAEYCTDYTDLKVYQASFELRDSDEDYAGDLNIRNDRNDADEGIYYWYFSKAGKISCNFGSMSRNIDAKKGWNKIYYKNTRIDYYNDDYDDYDYYYTREYSTSNILTKTVKWFVDYPEYYGF